MRKMIAYSLPVLTAGLFLMPVDAMAEAKSAQDDVHLKAGHKKVEGVVSDIKSGIYTVKTETGTYTLSEAASSRHGHGPKVGDEMVLWVNENNMVIDAHPKGQTAKAHRSISGKLVNMDNVKSEIKLSTPQGETTLRIKPETRGFADIPKGTPVTVELNEQGEVIDVHRDKR